MAPWSDKLPQPMRSVRQRKSLSTASNSINEPVEIVENLPGVSCESCRKPRRRKMALCLERYRTRIVEANK